MHARTLTRCEREISVESYVWRMYIFRVQVKSNYTYDGHIHYPRFGATHTHMWLSADGTARVNCTRRARKYPADWNRVRARVRIHLYK